MREIKGLYIEDEPKNITMLQALFSFCEGIEIEGLETLPQNINEYVAVIIEKKIDFVIIDHELEKMD